MKRKPDAYARSCRLRMKAYDKLPPATRAALQNADHDINPARLVAEMKDAGATDEELVRMVRKVRAL